MLSEDEVKRALEKAIKEKVEGLPNFYASAINLNGSVKIRNKSVRKDIKRITATIECFK